MIVTGVTSDGRCLERVFPIDDPSPEQISLKPNESVSGSVNLEKYFKDFRTALKNGDLHIFWAYQVPAQLGNRHWSGGWVLIPQGS